MFSHLGVWASVFTLALGLLLLVAGEAGLGPPYQQMLPLHWWPSSGTEDTILCLKAPALPPEHSSCAGRILAHCSIWSPDCWQLSGQEKTTRAGNPPRRPDRLPRSPPTAAVSSSPPSRLPTHPVSPDTSTSYSVGTRKTTGPGLLSPLPTSHRILPVSTTSGVPDICSGQGWIHLSLSPHKDSRIYVSWATGSSFHLVLVSSHFCSITKS